MKKISLSLILFLFAVNNSFAASIVNKDTSSPKSSTKSVSFKLKGTAAKKIMVTIGIGPQPESGACCSGVSPNTTAIFKGNVGDFVYDGKTRRIITKIYSELNGTTIDLAQYY
jgi:hypothetical protein